MRVFKICFICFQPLFCFVLLFGRWHEIPPSWLHAMTYEEWGEVVANPEQWTAGFDYVLLLILEGISAAFAIYAVVSIILAFKKSRMKAVYVCIVLAALAALAVYCIIVKNIGMDYMYYMKFMPTEILLTAMLALQLSTSKTGRMARNEK